MREPNDHNTVIDTIIRTERGLRKRESTVAVTDKRVLPKSYDANRYQAQLKLVYAIENKTARPIKQLKGWMYFLDATGDAVGKLPLNFDEVIPASKTHRTDTGFVWKMNEFSHGNIERIVALSSDAMKTRFEAEAIAFQDGEVIRAPSAE